MDEPVMLIRAGAGNCKCDCCVSKTRLCCSGVVPGVVFEVVLDDFRGCTGPGADDAAAALLLASSCSAASGDGTTTSAPATDEPAGVLWGE